MTKMTRAEAALWSSALVKASFALYREGDLEGVDFVDEWCFLLEEYIHDMPIQRKPY